MAFAIHRRVGTAVVRNRVRRRARAVTGALAPSLPIGAYVVHIGPGGPGLTFDELKVAMSRAMERAASLRSGSPAASGRHESRAGR
jgi:ribonuclease P protein component